MADSQKANSGYKKAPETKKNIQTGKKFKTPEFTPKSIDGAKTHLTTTKPDEPELDSYAKVNTKNTVEDDHFNIVDYDVELDVKGRSMAQVYYTNIIYSVRKYAEGRGQVVKKITIEMEDKKKMTNENVEKLVEKVYRIVKKRLSANADKRREK